MEILASQMPLRPANYSRSIACEARRAPMGLREIRGLDSEGITMIFIDVSERSAEASRPLTLYALEQPVN